MSPQNSHRICRQGPQGGVGSFDLGEAQRLITLGEKAAAAFVAELKAQALLATLAGPG